MNYLFLDSTMSNSSALYTSYVEVSKTMNNQKLEKNSFSQEEKDLSIWPGIR